MTNILNTSKSQITVASHVYFSATVVILLVVVHVSAWRFPVIQPLMVFDYARVRDGELWRFFCSWIIHADRTHLVTDALYLLAIMYIATYICNRLIACLVFLSCDLSGNLLSLFIEDRFSSTMGSSAGTHGLAAFVAGYFMLRTDGPAKWAWSVVLAYLFFMCGWAIRTGNMPWPFAHFENGGWDHGGAVAAGVLWSFVVNASRRRHEEHSVRVPHARTTAGSH